MLDGEGRIVARSLSLGGRVLPRQRSRGASIATGAAGVSPTRPRRATRCALYVGAARRCRAVLPPAARWSSPRRPPIIEDTIATRCASASSARRSPPRRSARAAVALLMRRALRRSRRLAASAAEIERTGDPRPAAARDRQPSDEVGRLATTLNAMLGSLERSREAERRFLADASHELRTPLTALRGNVAYLARHGATPELRRRPAEATRSGSRGSPTTCSRSRGRRRRRRRRGSCALDELVAALAERRSATS